MKYTVILSLLLLCFSCNKNKDADVLNESKLIAATVEASCGQCQFGLEGDGCNLAVRIDGKAYWVDGTEIDDHGDAHAEDGFCEAIRTAKVSGNIVDGRFMASSLQLTD